MSPNRPSRSTSPPRSMVAGPASMIFGGRQWLDVVQPALDTASIMAALVGVKWLARGEVDDSAWAMGWIAVVVFFLFSQLTGLQHRDRCFSSNDEIAKLGGTWTLTVLVMAVIGFLTRYSDIYARSVIVSWVLLCPAMIGLTRMCLRICRAALLRRGIGVRRVAIAGFNSLGLRTYANLVGEDSLGYQFVGFYDDRKGDRLVGEIGAEVDGGLVTSASEQVLGSLADLTEAARAGRVETVLVTLPMRAEARIQTLLTQLSDSTASVYIVPDFFVFELLHSRWTSVGGLPAVSVFENPAFGIDGVAKRAADAVLATFGIIVLALPMLAIAVAIKLTSRGPVFFRQRRYGLDGQVIRVWKFRSMTTCEDGAVVTQATKHDARITPLGAVLRRTSLDELPQLFNVLDGSMSLVGPRPHASAHNELYRGQIRGYMLRHKVRPGITGLAQVNGCRGETETIEKMQRRIEFDHQYIRTWSLGLDLRILMRTLMVAWKQPGAY